METDGPRGAQQTGASLRTCHPESAPGPESQGTLAASQMAAVPPAAALSAPGLGRGAPRAGEEDARPPGEPHRNRRQNRGAQRARPPAVCRAQRLLIQRETCPGPAQGLIKETEQSVSLAMSSSAATEEGQGGCGELPSPPFTASGPEVWTETTFIARLPGYGVGLHCVAVGSHGRI